MNSGGLVCVNCEKKLLFIICNKSPSNNMDGHFFTNGQHL